MNEFPAMAGLVNILNRNVFCGATIITDRYAVTAAHCFGHNMSITEFMLLVGDHNIHLGNDCTWDRFLLKNPSLKCNILLSLDEATAEIGQHFLPGPIQHFNFWN